LAAWRTVEVKLQGLGPDSGDRGLDHGSRQQSRLQHGLPGKWRQGNRLSRGTSDALHADIGQVPELWNEAGTVYVYLHPKGSRRGPSFKITDAILAGSRFLNELLLAETIATSRQPDGDLARGRSHARIPSESSGIGGGHLYLPLAGTDVESLVAARNLFAFLTNQPLVGTRQRPNIFAAFLEIAALLKRYEFSSHDGSSFGEPAESCFEYYLNELGLADVRHSREKTLEGLFLGEQMKSWSLYNEAFAHAVGKYDDLIDLKSALYDSITPNTRQRLERAHLDLLSRQANVSARLESF
jgi:hypothetical protein